MLKRSKNIEMLQQVALGLGDLREVMVFVGGAVTELYTDDPAASDIRPTIDVDCVVELGARKVYYELENGPFRRIWDRFEKCL